ncbi:helix-turn-helix domain-containing protein [Chitinophaga sedimenti]|nr:helix-turn-helix domain-containing protein [Chitinophaga sedimenti]
MDHFAPIRNEQAYIMPMCFLSGIDTRPTDAYWTSSWSHFGVSFYSHAMPLFFGISAEAITNLMPDLTWIDKTTLPEQLRSAASHRQRVKLVSGYLLEKLSKRRPDTVIQEIFSRRHDFDAWLLSKQHRLSERQLQRRFKHNTGISFAKFNRILRFEKALSRLSAARYGDLTQLAYELGYADQAHFIKDFSEFAGITPYTFVQQENLGGESSSFIYAADEA